MDNKIIFEKVKEKIAISNVMEEDIVMKKRNVNKFRIILASLLGILTCSGVVFAMNSEKIIKYFRGIGDGIDVAAENGYIENVDMESIEQKTIVESKKKLLENVDVGVKIEDFLMDNQNLSMKFRFDFDDSINDVINLDNIHNIELNDLFILDENNVLIYSMCYDEDTFNNFCQKHNLDLKIGEFNEQYLNNGLNSFPAQVSKELKMAELQYNMYTDEYPKSKKLNLYFTKISFVEENTDKKTGLIGDWNISLDVPEKMYNRTSESYKVVSCSNSDFNVYSCTVSDTGFEIGLIINNIEKVEFPKEIEELRRNIWSKYEGMVDQSAPNNEFQEALSQSPYYMEMYNNYWIKREPINYSGMCFENGITKYKEEGVSYVENSEGKQFKCTMSPSRKANGEWLAGNRYDFYETFGMTKYDSTDEIKVVLYYYGEPVTILLEKVK